MESSFIKLPPRVTQPDIWEKCQPKKLAHWLEELPTGDSIRASRQFNELLFRLNRVEGDSQTRFEVLEQLRPTLYDLLHYLKSVSVGSLFPMTAKREEGADLSISVIKEYTIGYWIVLNQLEEKSISKKLIKKKALIAQRALVSLTHVLLFHYLFKRPEPAGIWLDIHRLAASINPVVSKNKVLDKFWRKIAETSFEDCYKQILLLRLADPYRLLHTEVTEVFVSLEKWSAVTELSTSIEPQNLQKCIVDLDQDNPAFWLKENQTAPSNRICLNISPLIRLLTDHKEFVDSSVNRFEAAEFKGEHLPLSRELVDYLLNRWKGAESPLLPAGVLGDGSSRLFISGIRTIHQYLNPGSNFDDQMESEWIAETHGNNELICDFFDPEKVAIGSLIGFRRLDDARNRLSIGVINRIINKKGSHISFCLYLLAGKPQAAGIQPVTNRVANKTYQRVILFFTAAADDKKKTWIVAEARKMRVGSVVKLLTHREKVNARITQKIGIGSGCYLFECKVEQR